MAEKARATFYLVLFIDVIADRIHAYPMGFLTPRG